MLLDVMMPGLSGFDLLRTVRESGDIPVLILSARMDDSDKIRGLGLGADDYIVKSATPAEVVARVKAVLATGAAGRPNRYGRRSISSSFPLIYKRAKFGGMAGWFR